MVSTKGRYALRVMLDLAENAEEGYIPLKEVALRQEISEKYLENIISMLVRTGLLSAVRGKGGGYKLKKAPSEYTVKEILEVTEGSLAPVACLSNSGICGKNEICKTLPMWKRLDNIINGFFSGITLEELLKENDLTEKCNE